jgi:hypothetical protein
MNRRKLYGIGGILVAGSLAGGSVALATGGEDVHVNGAKAKQGRVAAAAYLGGGHAGSVELHGEHGATYDVEVHTAGGGVTDVWLDGSFRPIAAERDSEEG